MKTMKEFYLQIPEMGKLIVKATCKVNALIIYREMGHEIGADDIFMLKPPPRKKGARNTRGVESIFTKVSEQANYSKSSKG